MYELACCGCMWVRRRIYHNGAPAPAVMDARHRHTALPFTSLHSTNCVVQWCPLYCTVLYFILWHCSLVYCNWCRTQEVMPSLSSNGACYLGQHRNSIEKLSIIFPLLVSWWGSYLGHQRSQNQGESLKQSTWPVWPVSDIALKAQPSQPSGCHFSQWAMDRGVWFAKS